MSYSTSAGFASATDEHNLRLQDDFIAKPSSKRMTNAALLQLCMPNHLVVQPMYNQ